MTTEVLKREQPEIKETSEMTFRCKYCGKTRPLDEMRTLTRFFPLVVACRDCEKRMQ